MLYKQALVRGLSVSTTPARRIANVSLTGGSTKAEGTIALGFHSFDRYETDVPRYRGLTAGGHIPRYKKLTRHWQKEGPHLQWYQRRRPLPHEQLELKLHKDKKHTRQ